MESTVSIIGKAPSGIMAVAVAVLVIAAIILVYASCNAGKATARREKYRKLFNESSGVFDAPAKEALDTILSSTARGAEDAYTAATILDLNVGDGNLRGNRANRQNIQQLYTEALHDMQRNPVVPATQDVGLFTLFDVEEDENRLDPLFMVQHIGGFIDRNPDVLQREFIDLYAQTVPHVHAKKVEQARAEVVAKATAEGRVLSRAEAVEQLTDALETHNTDPQNVHDSAVNVGLRDTLATLRSTTKIRDFDKCSEELRQYISDNHRDSAKGQRALSALETISAGNFNSSIGANESEVFATVWSRADENTNTEQIREAVVDAMNDFYERGSANPVCINGRCGRLIGSLATLDRDPTVGAVQTLEQHRNDIMSQVSAALQREIDIASRSEDAGLKRVAESYTVPGVTADPAHEQRFIEGVKREIDTIIDAKKEVLGGSMETIKKDAYAALSV